MHLAAAGLQQWERHGCGLRGTMYSGLVVVEGAPCRGWREEEGLAEELRALARHLGRWIEAEESPEHRCAPPQPSP